ncbi:hypothetical protein GEV26_01150 [Aeromicrobium yanjiei]|uniref:PucR family transcriptional regulator n=1 Tax=Aeromicrobium yanjiei TaxID=2662028 RepID=A0A5Q2MGB6_9ACTN|nr:hypothetical protein GEV26_01150 [Aeromicrobium yanjiei]
MWPRSHEKATSDSGLSAAHARIGPTGRRRTVTVSLYRAETSAAPIRIESSLHEIEMSHPDAPPNGLTIADFLAMPITQRGMPLVVTGHDQLDRKIRWVHAIELADTQGLLEGGELILATGISLPQSADALGAYVGALADQDVSALVMELGRRFHETPGAMIQACARRGLPLIVLRREVPFIKITEAAHTTIIVGQQRLLRATTAAHERFTELTLADGSVDDLVAAAADLACGEVVFANLMHEVISFNTRGRPVETLLSRWNRRAKIATAQFGTVVDEEGCTVSVPVEVRGRRRGHLVLYADDLPQPAQVMVVERAAAALSIRLFMEDDETLVSHARRTALSDIIDGRFVSEDAMHARIGSLGHATRNAVLVPVLILSRDPNMPKVLKQALVESRIDAVTGHLGGDRWAALLLLKSSTVDPLVEDFARHVHDLSDGDRPTIAAGATVTTLLDVGRSFAEALEVAMAASSSEPYIDMRPFYGIHHIKLRGLLFTMRDDPRLQSFVERTIGPLIERDSREGGDWVRTVALYLKYRGNKTLAAQALGISRPTLYERLARVQRMLHLDLDDPESSTSLHAAIMVAQAHSGHAHGSRTPDA